MCKIELNFECAYIAVVGVKLSAMETKDVRQRFVGSQHQRYSYQYDGSLQDEDKHHSVHWR